MLLKSKDLLLIGILVVAFICIASVSTIFVPESMMVISLAALLCIITMIQFELFRRLQYEHQQRFWDYRQTEALFSMTNMIKLNAPLPAMRDWAIGPDMGNILIHEVKRNKPSTIVELGSGVSTVLMSYAIMQNGNGRIKSFDHDGKYVKITASNLAKHGLEDFANVVHAPLKDTKIGDKAWRWYDVSKLEGIGKIDLLVIDGPPEQTQNMARYPAVPILLKHLSEKAVIILDDAARDDEKKIVKAWQDENGCFDVEYVNTEKGAAILRRRAQTLVKEPISSEH